MHENGQIDHNCAINCEILGNKNAGNKYTTKSKNLSDIRSILKYIHWFVIYIILALVSLGQLCSICAVQGKDKASYYLILGHLLYTWIIL